MKLWIKLALYLLACLLFALGSLEVYFRWENRPPKFAYDWQYHPLLGHTGPVSVEFEAGNVKNTYNEFGFRGPRLIAEKNPELLILGDSMTESNYLPWEQSFAGLLPNTEIFASADYGNLEPVLALENLPVRPKKILLQFLGLNDYVNNTLSLADRNKSWSDFARPYLKDGALTRANALRSWLLEHSALFRLVYAIRISRLWDSYLTHAPPEPDCPHEIGLFLENPNPDWQEAYATTLAILKRAKSAAAAKGAALHAMYLPSNVEADDGLWSQGIAPQLQRCFPGQKTQRWQGEARFLALAEAAGIPAFSLRTKFAGPEADKLFYIPGGHFSAAGHALTAKEIKKQLGM